MPSERQLTDGYERGYGPYDGPGPSRQGGPIRQALRRIWHLVDGVPALERVKLCGPILDVGAGHGDVVQDLRARGFEVEGLEPNKQLVKAALGAGVYLRVGSLETADLPSEHFGAVLLNQVVEHFREPELALRRIAQLLAPQGKLVIATPNAYGAPRRIFGREWAHWHVPYHLHLFGKTQLLSLLDQAGFEVEDMRTLTPGFWITMSWSLWRHRSQASGWTLAGTHSQPALMVRILLAPPMRVIDLVGLGDCLFVVARKKAG